MAPTPEPTRAPLLGELLPVELMNTVWAGRGHVHDALGTDGEAVAWLRAVGPRLTETAPGVAAWLATDPPADLGATADGLRRLRDALRRLAADATQDPRPAAASATRDRDAARAVLNEIVAAAPPWPALDWPPGGEPARTLHVAHPAGPGIAALLASESIALLAGEGRSQLRACLAPGCVLYFAKDHNRREWCSPGCGNRARAARHYQRRKSDLAGRDGGNV
ncbi:CGNR zinc finger domain-containing protein [Promicromonospora iranensis]|uniref:RNA-binding Zn ribbon-like protein n=1 Tax=Promicromonospora iranensis TaxID=1105144 RepID=A0ABU2CPB2_9MICO|nr:CGNR zinc finger domain-containing protein [Promicromonospora iranensis]MDR7383186.1 putative RNA-binding Zn ribbon-like protein [Promicromonospora iranensis]